jgi:hypothetical protein
MFMVLPSILAPEKLYTPHPANESSSTDDKSKIRRLKGITGKNSLKMLAVNNRVFYYVIAEDSL